MFSCCVLTLWAVSMSGKWMNAWDAGNNKDPRHPPSRPRPLWREDVFLLLACLSTAQGSFTLLSPYTPRHTFTGSLSPLPPSFLPWELLRPHPFSLKDPRTCLH